MILLDPGRRTSVDTVEDEADVAEAISRIVDRFQVGRRSAKGDLRTPSVVAGHNTFPGSAACKVVRIEESRSRCPRRSPGGMIGARMR